jgi:hypothetical protein
MELKFAGEMIFQQHDVFVDVIKYFDGFLDKFGFVIFSNM